MSEPQGVAVLREEIVAEAKREAAEELHSAEAAANAEVGRAREAARQEQEAIVRQAEHEAEALRRQARSVAEVEAKKRQLEVREGLIRRVLDEAVARLSRQLPPVEQGELLLRLIVEAGQEIGGGEIAVHVSPADLPLVTPDLLRESECRLAAAGMRAHLAVAQPAQPVEGGVVLTREEGRVLVDNSLRARMQRREGVLRAEVWRVLSGADRK